MHHSLEQVLVIHIFIQQSLYHMTPFNAWLQAKYQTNRGNILKKMTNVPTDGYKTFIQYILDKLVLDLVSFCVITIPLIIVCAFKM